MMIGDALRGEYLLSRDFSQRVTHPPGAGTDSAHAAAQRGKTKGTTMVLRRVSEPQVKAATLTLRTI